MPRYGYPTVRMDSCLSFIEHLLCTWLFALIHMTTSMAVALILLFIETGWYAQGHETYIWRHIFKLWKACINLSFFFNFSYLFLERGEVREKERETWMCGCLSCAPYWGPGLQPRHVPWLGIEPVILCLAVQHSIHWATPARALNCLSILAFDILRSCWAPPPSQC